MKSLICIFGLLALCRPQLAINKITHRGINNCFELKRDNTTVVIVPAWAGRLSVLDFGEGNLLYQNPAVDGKKIDLNQSWMNWDGNATDIVNEKKQSQWPGLWLHPWTKIKKIKNGVVLASDKSTKAGLAIQKKYILSEDGQTLNYAVTIKNISDSEMKWTVWERAMAPAGGYMIMPVAQNANYPDGWKVRDNTKKILPADLVVPFDNYLIVYPGSQKGAGFSVLMKEGWMAYVHPKGIWYLKWEIPENAEYPYYDNSQAVFWISKEYIEIEPLSPQISLQPKKTYTFIQEWQWQAFDKKVKISKYKNIVNIIENNKKK